MSQSFSCSREALQAALGRVGLALPRRQVQIPVLECVRIVPSDAGLQLAATNLDQTITTALSVDGAADFAGFPVRVVPGLRLSAIVAQLPPAPVTIEATTNGVRICAGRARFDVQGMGADEFPVGVLDRAKAGAKTGETTGTWIEIADAPALLAALGRAVTHCSHEMSRPTLGGVHVRSETDGRLLVEATTGFCLMREWLDAPSAKRNERNMPSLDLIVPRVAAVMAGKLFADAESLRLRACGQMVELTGGGETTLRAGTTEGPFPETDRVFNQQFTRSLTVDSGALATAIKRVASLSNAPDPTVCLDIGPDGTPSIRVHLTAVDIGVAEDHIALDGVPEPMRIGFNPSFLLDALAIRRPGRLRLDYQAPERAIALHDPGVAIAQGLVMPKRILDPVSTTGAR